MIEKRNQFYRFQSNHMLFCKIMFIIISVLIIEFRLSSPVHAVKSISITVWIAITVVTVWHWNRDR